MSFAPKGSTPGPAAGVGVVVAVSGGGSKSPGVSLCKRCSKGDATRKVLLETGEWSPLCEACAAAWQLRTQQQAQPSPSPALNPSNAQQQQALPSPFPARSASDASLRKPTNYLVGVYDSKILQDACSAMQSAEREASKLAQAHLDAVLRVGEAASMAIEDSAAANRATSTSLKTLADKTESLKLGFDNGAGCCGCVLCTGLRGRAHSCP